MPVAMKLKNKRVHSKTDVETVGLDLIAIISIIETQPANVEEHKILILGELRASMDLVSSLPYRPKKLAKLYHSALDYRNCVRR